MTDSRLWFRAKTYGWGWGLPLSWQGWVAYGLYAALVAASALAFPPVRHMFAFGVCLWSLTLLLVAVCWLKGEKPGSRWGR